MNGRPSDPPASSDGEAGTSAPHAKGAGPGDPRPGAFRRLGLKIADLTRELADIAALAGENRLALTAMEPAAAAFRRMIEAWAAAPDAFAQAHTELLARHTDIFRAMSAGEPSHEGDRDRRFSDPSWRDNPFADYMRRTFLAQAAWSENLAWTAPGLSESDRRKAAFFMRQASAALSPSNLLSANPRALKALFSSEGRSISEGFERLQRDFDAGGGRIRPEQSDPEAFRPGDNIAVTPGEVVLRNELIELIRYHASTEAVLATPILIFPPWINKYYILDLTPENSLVAWLRDQGFTVYIISWKPADETTRSFDWDDYLRLGARTALGHVAAAHGSPPHAVGYCMGGALLCVLAARLAQEGRTQDHIGSLTLLAAQTDFSDPGDLSLFADEAALRASAELIADSGGVMPGEAMAEAFNLLRPEDLIWRFVEERYLLGQPPEPFDLLHWNSDQADLPGPLHMTSLRELYGANALAQGTFPAEGTIVGLEHIDAPVFIHAARKDHISPFPSVYRTLQILRTQATFLLADSGHIAGVVNPPSAGKYRYWTNPEQPATAELWLEGAQETPGSWWPVWSAWLTARSGAQTAPPPRTEDAQPAPGDYVRIPLPAPSRRSRA
ncbi:MAG: alpha/beta fold hydrolase [Alphaproteobacteria bacterium]|nr:alpha/beta fold hydrolase [Alphaproteobacteria bacterium]